METDVLDPDWEGRWWDGLIEMSVLVDQLIGADESDSARKRVSDE